MTFTVEEAKANLPQIIAQAEAGEEVLIAHDKEHPTIKLVPLKTAGGRLTPHPTFSKALVIHDQEALVKPLPPEEWGDLSRD